MQRQNSERTLVSETHRQYVSIDLDLIAVKCRPPVKILCAEHNWLLISAMLQDCNVDWLVQLQEHARIELDFFIVSDELKHESLVKDGVARALHNRSGVAILQETHCYGHLFVWAHIDEVDKGIASEHSAAHVPLVWI